MYTLFSLLVLVSLGSAQILCIPSDCSDPVVIAFYQFLVDSDASLNCTCVSYPTYGGDNPAPNGFLAVLLHPWNDSDDRFNVSAQNALGDAVISNAVPIVMSAPILYNNGWESLFSSTSFVSLVSGFGTKYLGRAEQNMVFQVTCPAEEPLCAGVAASFTYTGSISVDVAATDFIGFNKPIIRNTTYGVDLTADPKTNYDAFAITNKYFAAIYLSDIGDCCGSDGNDTNVYTIYANSLLQVQKYCLSDTYGNGSRPCKPCICDATGTASCNDGFDGDGTCNCKTGYIGADCSTQCSGSCGANAFCNANDGSCQCHPGYYGRSCVACDCPATSTITFRCDDLMTGSGKCLLFSNSAYAFPSLLLFVVASLSAMLL